MPLIVDSHQDIAWNMLALGRDYTRSAAETRRIERGGPNVEHNGDSLLGWPDYQQGQVAVVFSTLFAAPLRHSEGDWDSQVYADFEQAHRLYRAQLDAYHRLCDQHPDKFRLIASGADLRETLSAWERPLEAEQAGRPVGFVVLMEGAEGIRHIDELPAWVESGVRMIGPAWAGTRFCGGTREPGPLTDDGRELLEAMAGFNLILDLSHMDALSARQALDLYPGPVAASHSNALALLKGSYSNRHLTDEVIAGILERDGVIGVVPYNKFLKPGWTAAEGKQAVTLAHLAAHIDHICQMAGDARHAGLGTDFDGGFGWASTPSEINTIADLQKLGPLLAERGYSPMDIEAILGGNWLRFLREALP